MNLTEVITVISALTVVIGIAVTLLNKRIGDTNKRIDELRQELKEEIRELRQEFKEELREIRQLLYKVLEIPQKEDK
ncbi:MAG: hypothetical protein N3C57_04625 [Aquificaceae bacterium]|nr:hypothetical protein [Aquificaceae bacterium]